MIAKHPERKPADQVKGAIDTDVLTDHTLMLQLRPSPALDQLVHVLSTTAERTVRRRKEQAATQEAA